MSVDDEFCVRSIEGDKQRVQKLEDSLIYSGDIEEKNIQELAFDYKDAVDTVSNQLEEYREESDEFDQQFIEREIETQLEDALETEENIRDLFKESSGPLKNPIVRKSVEDEKGLSYLRQKRNQYSRAWSVYTDSKRKLDELEEEMPDNIYLEELRKQV